MHELRGNRRTSLAAETAPGAARRPCPATWPVAAWLAGLGLGLLLAYRGAAPLPVVVGLVTVLLLAAARPEVALLFVPLTAPLFAITPRVPGLDPELAAMPPHELALLAAGLGTIARWLLERAARAWSSGASKQWTAAPPAGGAQPTMHDARRSERLVSLRPLVALAPYLLFLLAGVAGLLLALPLPEAQRDAGRAFRWFIAEPLLFAALLRARARSGGTAALLPLVAAFVASGAAAGLLGLLQFAGLDPFAPPGGGPRFFGVVGGLPRATAVYGNPNNLGLYLGRVWPLAAALALAARRTTKPGLPPTGDRRASSRGSARGDEGQDEGDERRMPATLVGQPFRHWTATVRPPSFVLRPWWAAAALLCLGGMLVSFSRGAWLGAAAAVLVLALPAALVAPRGRGTARCAPPPRPDARQRPAARLALLAAGVLALAAGLMLGLRGGVAGESAGVRLLLWREALVQIAQHPLGLGLDQFYYYHNPAFGRSLINPALARTLERDARQPHTLLLELWLNLTPLGVVAFAWLLMRAARDAWATLRLPAGPSARAFAWGALASLAAALIHGLVDTFYFWPDLALSFWLCRALCESSKFNASQTDAG
jgi:putative inorganic carbon (HCO3(-)) transporter